MEVALEILVSLTQVHRLLAWNLWHELAYLIGREQIVEIQYSRLVS